MKYGYALVSTDDQNSATQLTALRRPGCKTLFKYEGVPAATTKCPSLLHWLKTLQSGDTLTVWKLDRLGRSLRDLITMLDDLKRRVVKFRFRDTLHEAHEPVRDRVAESITIRRTPAS